MASVRTWAEYMMPPLRTVVTGATAIIDATVVELEEHGGVRIEVHSLLKGNDPPDVLTGTGLTCLEGVDLSRMLRVGQRYVLILRESSLYATETAYEVRRGKSDLECNCWDGSAEMRRRWMPISEFAELLKATRQP